MLPIIHCKMPTEWAPHLKRPTQDSQQLTTAVQSILHEVKRDGDVALRKLTEKLDKAYMPSFVVSQDEFVLAGTHVPPELKDAIKHAYANIEKFHASQRDVVTPVETQPGVSCWRKSVAIEKVGLYIPGGTAPLFSTVLMLGIPAKLAGCGEIVLCTPPDPSGNIHPAFLFAAKLVGIKKVFKVGGAQAIAAMAYGTTLIPKVHKIFGPGNQYVMEAKALVQKEGIAIDLPAGPSEVLVVADTSCVPAYVAADLLSQAEHGPDSQVILVTDSEEVANKVNAEVKAQVEKLPRKAICEQALAHSKCFVVPTLLPTAVTVVNEYAPEHLILSVREADQFADKVVNAGSVFIGNYAPEAVGDYSSGTNHTLPTNGYATAYSGVSLDSFVKKNYLSKVNARRPGNRRESSGHDGRSRTTSGTSKRGNPSTTPK